MYAAQRKHGFTTCVCVVKLVVLDEVLSSASLCAINIYHKQGCAQEGAKVARATACLPSSTEVGPPKEIYIYLFNSITAAELHVGLDKIIAE